MRYVDPGDQKHVTPTSTDPAQATLFEPLREQAHARRDDMAESHEAAARASVKIRESQQEVLQLLIRADRPLTDPEIERIARLEGIRQSPSGLRTRRAELRDAGLVAKVGSRDGFSLWAAADRGAGR